MAYSTTDDYNKEIFLISINVWNNAIDSLSAIAIDQFADNLKNGLDEFSYVDDNVGYTVYFTGRSVVEDPNQDLQRRRITFRVDVYYA